MDEITEKIKKPLWKRPSIWILGIVLSWLSYQLIIPAAFNYSGRCSIDGKWYTAEEKMNIAIKNLITNGVDETIGGLDLIEHEFIPSFKNVQEFKDKNPNCCKILGKNDPSLKSYEWLNTNNISKMFGTSEDLISLRFTENRIYKKSNNILEENIYIIARPNNCGMLWVNYSVINEVN